MAGPVISEISLERGVISLEIFPCVLTLTSGRLGRWDESSKTPPQAIFNNSQDNVRKFPHIRTQEKFIPVIDISSVTLKLSMVFRYRNCNTSAMYGSILSVINQEENPSRDRKRTFCTNDH